MGGAWVGWRVGWVEGGGRWVRPGGGGRVSVVGGYMLAL